MVPGFEDPKIDANMIPVFQEPMVPGTQGPRICEDLRIAGNQKYGMQRLMVSSLQALGVQGFSFSGFDCVMVSKCIGVGISGCESSWISRI